MHVREAVQHAAESAASHSYYSIKRVGKEGKKKRKGRCFQEGRWGAVGTLNGLRLGNTRKTYRFDLVQVSWSLWGCERFLGACKHCDRVVVREKKLETVYPRRTIGEEGGKSCIWKKSRI